jgi:hypothetical protein
MSPDDTIPPESGDTLPPPANDTDPPLAIPAGFASLEFSRALDRVHVALHDLEALGASFARQLDSQVDQGEP